MGVLLSVIKWFGFESGQLEDIKSNSLSWIDLEDNNLQDHFPKSILRLILLDLSSNNFSGHVDVSLFSIFPV